MQFNQNISCIYRIVNLINNNIYVGSAVKAKNRCSKHVSELNQNRHHSRHLQFSWNFYGKENFKFEVIELCEKEKLTEREQFYLDTLKPEYNTCLIAGSPLGLKRSAETKAKMSQAWLTREPASLEIRAKMSASAKIKNFSENHRLSMSIAQKDRKHPQEVKDKISQSHINKKHSPEHCKNNGLAKRKPNKWPHEKGNRCNCRECLDIRNADEKIRREKRKLKS